MNETETQPAMTYPRTDQYEGWKEEAEKMDMSVSEWMQAMIEAGRKKFEVSVNPDEDRKELRRQRNDLRDRLDDAQERIRSLEDRLAHGERQTIREFVAENPGAEYSEIVQHVGETVPERVTGHLDTLEGEDLEVDANGNYYPTDEDSDE